MMKAMLLSLLCLICVGIAHAEDAPTDHTGFVSFMTEVDGEQQPSVVYVPDGYDASKEWPLVVFLHGMGERGSDGEKQAEVGIGRAIRNNPERFPCLVLMPQCSRTTTWSASTNSKGAVASEHIDAAIQQVQERYNVDIGKVSLTGLSMGGYGTFSYGTANIDRFCAMMPICGGGNPDNAETLAKVPMRVFHGGADPVVKPVQSTRMVEAIRAAGGDVEYTEYPGVGHNSWDNAYGDAKAIEWLLAQSR